VLITRSTVARRREQSLERLDKLPRKRAFERPEDPKPVVCRYLSIYHHIGVTTYEYKYKKTYQFKNHCKDDVMISLH